MKIVDYVIIFAIVVISYLIHNKTSELYEVSKENNALILKAKKLNKLQSRYSNERLASYLKQKASSKADILNSTSYVFESLDVNGINRVVNKVLNSHLKLKSFEIIKLKKLAKLKVVVVK